MPNSLGEFTIEMKRLSDCVRSFQSKDAIITIINPIILSNVKKIEVKITLLDGD